MIGKIRYSYIIIALAIIVYVLGYYLIVNKKKYEFVKIRGEYQKIQEELNKAKAVAEKKGKALLEYMIVKKRWEKANDMLPSTITLTNLLNEVSRYAGISGVKILLFKPSQNIIEKGEYGELPIDLEISGGFHSIGRFLAAINNMSRIVNVNSLSIKSAKSEREKLTASLNVSAYVGIKGGVKDEKGKKKRTK